ncbi:simple sugar transport system ATP-binding protein [Paenibacillus phyllosphaerae]|uniref:Simple sugar transport system ATP-binding protein n=1 Tax=Paenibacillus phyllosphaerae TaxID=274593 RepID=A0A7W5B318_9BACL|nr:ABC transporter ATP-binding protein [Paenibacillus phyllosphaerae]MBB3113525.1 simple sugar transport system ATP-binding protein [Paenibacillus phyllosphaerae]
MLLQMKGITKRYGSLTANSGVDFSLEAGEVHALVGENGAGKSTLMRILYGEEQPSEGRIYMNGTEQSFSSPSDAIAAGIGMVHQHFMLFPSFTVAENIVIGREPKAGVTFDRKAAAEQVKALSEKYGMPVDPWAKVAECPVGVQQRIEILKVLNQGAKIVIMDEPTGALTPLEVEWLLKAIKRLSEQGISFILISHKLHEVLDSSERITVLRDGRVTGTVRAKDTDALQLSSLMVGRELVKLEKKHMVPGQPILDVQQVTVRGGKGAKPLLDQVSFQVRAGEIVGVAGVSGNGQSELLQAVTGLRRIDVGKVALSGQDVTGRSPFQFREAGLAHIPEDRYMWGSAKEESVTDNGLMGHLRSFSKGGILRKSQIRQTMADWVRSFNIKTGSLDTKAGHLSGGNMQKLIVAREMAHGTPFVIAAEPTRGVDIGAMETIHEALLKRREEQGAILLVSSELTEILKLSDRILVLFEGRIAGELTAEEATEEQISILMAGGEQR